MSNAAEAKRIAHALVPMASAYLVTEANAQVWREQMDSWDRAELARYEYKTAAKWLQGNRPTRIVEPKHTYLMDDSDYAEFSRERQIYVDSLNLGLAKGHCPALVAEELCRKAGRILLEEGCRLLGRPGFTVERIYNRLEWTNEALDLFCGMAVSTGKIK